MLRPAYLRTKLTKALPTKDGGILRTVEGARVYMLKLSKHQTLRAQWQSACALLLAEAVAALTDQIELGLFYDARLDVSKVQ